MKMSKNERKAYLLATLTTRDSSGRHFTQWLSDSDIAEFEADGLITVTRPEHSTGIPYDSSHWSVEVTPDGVDYYEAYINQ
jgi:hypothetical protein